MNYKYMLWVDLETTGTDERMDSIIEFGWILTDSVGVLMNEGATVIQPSSSGLHRLYYGPRVVFEMHRDNGLLLDLRNGEDIHKFDRRFSAFLLEAGLHRGNAILAGSGVSHFDDRFLKVQLPMIRNRLAYPCLDVGQFRRVLKLAGRSDLVDEEQANAKTHRGLDDIRAHRAEYLTYVEWLHQLQGEDT